jgi:hypothetical protein
MARTASLTSGLVAKKGEATPATSAIIKAPAARDESAGDYYKALTVKLDRRRYESLKNVGVKLDKKSQEIFVEALDLWLKQSAGRQA